MANNFRGWVKTTRTGLFGWVVDLDDPDRPVRMSMVVNGTPVHEFVADMEVPTLREKGFDDVRRGFEIDLRDVSDLPGFQDLDRVVLKAVHKPVITLVAKDWQTVWLPYFEEEALIRAEREARGDQGGSGPEPEASESVLAQEVRSLAFLLKESVSKATMLEQGHAQAARASRAAIRAVRDATKKVWGGYSTVGARELRAIVDSPAYSPTARAEASFELARFYADTGRPHSAARAMATARALSGGFMDKLKPRLLEADLLIVNGDHDEAERKLSGYRDAAPDVPDYVIGLSNVALARGDVATAIGHLGEMYARAGLARIATDPAQPFLGLRAEAEPPAVEDGPKVTVMMSCFEAEAYLDIAVGSMQRQTWRNLEILIVDDNSRDGSRAKLHQLAAGDPRITVIENDGNLGTYGNRNQMLARASGDFVTVHDADDWSHPQMIEHQIRHLLDNPEIRVNTTLMCRSSQDLRFNLRPSRGSLEYCHMNYPGFLMRTSDVRALGGWDPIMANADAEFERRIKRVFGAEAFEVINRDVPYSFFLVHDKSLTQRDTTNLRSLNFGLRHEYHRQSEHWLQTRRAEAESSGEGVRPFVIEGRASRADPFPCPNGLLPPALRKDVLERDVLIVSDLSLLGGTRGCNVAYARKLHEMGMSVAMFHWPRADLRLSPDISATYRALAQEGTIDIITAEDHVRARRVIVHHPPIAATPLDRFPRIETDRVSFLVNQLPFQTTERDRLFYEPAAAERIVRSLADVDTMEWIPISPLTRRYLAEHDPDLVMSDDDWFPPHHVDPGLVTRDPADRIARLATRPVFVRHCRDHWTKWPGSADRIRAAYRTDSRDPMRVMGGVNTVLKHLGAVPDAWEVIPYDGVPVPELLNDGDVYVNANNEVYIEEFGRNVMEAFAFGLPVIADPVFGETFGDTILPIGPEGAEAAVDRLRGERGLAAAQVEAGRDFVRRHCSGDALRDRLSAYLD